MFTFVITVVDRKCDHKAQSHAIPFTYDLHCLMTNGNHTDLFKHPLRISVPPTNCVITIGDLEVTRFSVTLNDTLKVS